jgi:hypothetical protein
MHIDSQSLNLLLAIAVLSYVAGFLCGQMLWFYSPGDGTLPRQ